MIDLDKLEALLDCGRAPGQVTTLRDAATNALPGMIAEIRQLRALGEMSSRLLSVDTTEIADLKREIERLRELLREERVRLAGLTRS